MATPRLTLRNTLAAGLLLLVAAACGGGGGGSTAPQNVPPTASFITSNASGYAPLTVSFDAAGSADSDGTIVSYQWQFGDGTSASGVQGDHEFVDPGTYVVTLVVTDDDGASASTTRIVEARAIAVSGTVQILSSSAVDSDVNDRLTEVRSNDDFANAQPLPNPVLLGGFLNLPGTGATSGNLFASGDAADVYRLISSGNDLILLTVADADADLDLQLYDDQENFLDASVTLEPTESLEITQPGTYYIRVVPAAADTNLAGASNYVLSVGQNLGVTRRAANRVSDLFVPGELLLETRDADAETVTNSHGLRPRTRGGPFMLAALSNAAIAAAEASRPGAGNRDPGTPLNLSEADLGKYRTLRAVKRLRRDPDVTLAEPNALRFAQQTPNDRFYGLQWHYPAIRLPSAWDLTTGAPLPGDDEVIVAVVDTGVLSAHPDLQGQLVAGYDFISDPQRARDGDGIDPDPEDAGDLAYGLSSSFHGTHVIGTVAARSNNAIGVAGVSWGARVMPLRALGVGGGTAFDVIQAVRYAARLSNSSGTVPARRADIINLSLGSSFFSSAEQDVYDQVRAAGIIVVASAGNTSSTAPSYPAAYAGVLDVSATDIGNRLAPYSSFGPTIDLAAPGGYNLTDQNGDGIGDGVISTLGSDAAATLQYGYASLNGTSMAAPHVAGVAALMKAVHPGLTPAQFTQALIDGDLTDDLGTPGRDDAYGYGLVNAHKAVLAAIGLESGTGTDPGPILAASPSSLNFGTVQTDTDVAVTNLGTGSVTIDVAQTSEPWLTTAPLSVDPVSGLGTYRLHVDRSGLADGTYVASATFTPTDPGVGSAVVNVVMQVSSVNIDADAGLHYVLLVDDAGNTVGTPQVLTVDAGRYPFRFTNVAPGDYRLVAGSDMDDDGFLCDAGEACGAFRTLDEPETLIVSPETADSLTGLDFVSEFRAVISSPFTGPTAAGGSGGIHFERPDGADRSAGKEAP